MCPQMARNPVVALLLLALTALPCGAQTPTLGELAKKEQERRKALKGTVRVVTSQDVPKGTVPAPAPASGAAAPAADPNAQQKPDEPPRDEAWWKARLHPLREDLRRSEMFAEALQTRINSLSADFAARDDPYQRARIGEDRVKAIAELDRVKADLEATKKRIADLEEEARRAGVPPGWLR